MFGLVRALERRARALGVELLYEHCVERILVERGRATGVIAGEEFRAADVVVFNGDASALANGLLGAGAARGGTPTPAEHRSLSAVTWAMRARVGSFPLVQHNVFFSDDYRLEFDSILGRGEAPSEPTVYVCAQDRGERDDRPLEERLLVLINAPANGDRAERWTERERVQCTTATTKMLARAGLELNPLTSVQTTPAEFHRMFPGTGGALYGPRSRGAMSVLSRPGAASKVPRLYLAGGSVHPGPGVPMAALSGRLAAAKIREDLGSTG
jgi:1-hydroxycarotenoid 3,4-desaturase